MTTQVTLNGKIYGNIEVVGIDHGYKNMKTRGSIYPTAISRLSARPDDLTDVLEFGRKYYTLMGERVLSVENRDKSDSEEFYLLTLSSLAKELTLRKHTGTKGKPVNVLLAAGLPYKWYENQKDGFLKKLMSHPSLEFSFEGKPYYVNLLRASLYMQGVAAMLSDKREYMAGYKIIVDIGGETINIIPVENGKVIRGDCRIVPRATIALMRSIIEGVETEFYETLREQEIIDIIKRGRRKTEDKIDNYIQERLASYSGDVLRHLKEFGFNTSRSDILYEGGGATIIKNFSTGDLGHSFFITDLCATAKGYDVLEFLKIRRDEKKA